MISHGDAADAFANFHKGRWTKEEHEGFVRGLNMYGRDWKNVQLEVRTLFTDLWMTVAAASTEVDRLLALGRRGVERAGCWGGGGP